MHLELELEFEHSAGLKNSFICLCIFSDCKTFLFLCLSAASGGGHSSSSGLNLP